MNMRPQPNPMLAARCRARNASTHMLCNEEGYWHAIKRGGKIAESLILCKAHNGVVWSRRDDFHIHRVKSACDLPGSKFDAFLNRCYRDDVTIEHFLRSGGETDT